MPNKYPTRVIITRHKLQPAQFTAHKTYQIKSIRGKTRTQEM